MKNCRLSAFVLLVFAAALGCGPGSPSGDSCITQFGTYASLKPNDTTLVIFQGDGLVRFQLKDSTGQVLMSSDLKPSVHSKWFFYWDEATATLWFNSSDIGTYLWYRNDSGGYSRKAFAALTNDEKQAVPPDFWEKLPRSLTKNRD